MAILTRDITAVDSQSGFTDATFANLSTIDGTVATSTAPAGGTITMSLADAPGDYDSLNSLTLTVRARTNGTASRAKSVLVELIDLSNVVITSFTTGSLTTTLTTYTSGALTPSLTATQLTDARLRITVQEAGGMADSVTTSVDYCSTEINYTTVAPQEFAGEAALTGTSSIVVDGTLVLDGAGALTGAGSLAADGSFILGPVVEPWSLLGATWVQNFAIGAVDNNPQDLFIDSTGTRLYILGRTNNILQQWSMSAWDISTLTHVRNFSLSVEGTIPTSLYFKEDGTKVYITFVDTDVLAQYTLGTAWDISTCSVDSTTSIATDANLGQSLFITPDGTKAIIGTYSGTVEDRIVVYTMGTAWDASTISFTSSTIIGTSLQPTGIRFSSDGLRMFVSNIETLGEFDDSVIQFQLSAAYDPTTAVQTQDFYLGTEDLSVQGIHFKPDGTKMFIIGSAGDRVHEYTLFTTSTLEGAATLTGTGSLTADGVISAAPQSGEASLTASGSLVVAGDRVTIGSSSLTGTGSITALANRFATTDASLSAVGSISVNGLRQVVATAFLSGTGSLTAEGVIEIPVQEGASILSGNGNTTAVGTVLRPATGTLTGVGSLVVNGTVERLGATSLSGSGTITADGVDIVTPSGASTLLGTGTITASALVTRVGEVSIAASGSITASPEIPVAAVVVPRSRRISRASIEKLPKYIRTRR